jgi:hypothetical protein
MQERTPSQNPWPAPTAWEPQPLAQAETPQERSTGITSLLQRWFGTCQNGDLCGHVLVVEPGHPEPPPFNFCRLLAGLIWLLVSAFAPLAVFVMLLQSGGGMSALVFLVLIYFGIRFFAGWLMPSNLLSLLHLRLLLNPASRRHHDDVPVYFIRVRSEEGDETEVRLQGRLTHGNVRMHDWMSFWGTWRRGVLSAHRAWNHRTRSWVNLHPSQSWTGLAVAIVALTLALLCLIDALQ